MHEMAIAQSILKIVLNSAQQNSATKVKTVRIRAGELRGIVQSQLSFLFDFVTKDTIAEGAALVIKRLPVLLKCRRCDTEYEPPEQPWLCPQCGGYAGELLQGQELLIESMEIDE